MSARTRFDALWDTLTVGAADAALARLRHARARRRRLRRHGRRRQVPIPPILTPTAIERARMSEVSTQAHLITRALTKLTVDLMEDPTRAPLKQRLFGAFTALEAEALGTTWRKSEQLATVRVDFLVDTDGRARALEVNSTIPAMQGYSDAIAAAFIARRRRARAPCPSRSPTRSSTTTAATPTTCWRRCWRTTSGSAAAAAARSRSPSSRAPATRSTASCATTCAAGKRSAIASSSPRRRRCASTTGARSSTATSPTSSIATSSRAGSIRRATSRACASSPSTSTCSTRSRATSRSRRCWACLSAAAVDDDDAARIGLDDDERDAVAQAVPWTRLLQHGPTTGPDGEAIDELAGWVRAHGRALVLKRSWDYGGKGVFLGNELTEGAVAEARLRTLLGALTGGGGRLGRARRLRARRSRRLGGAGAGAGAARAHAARRRATASRRAISTSTCRRSPTSARRRGRRAARCARPRAASSTSSVAAACRRWCATTCCSACSTSARLWRELCAHQRRSAYSRADPAVGIRRVAGCAAEHLRRSPLMSRCAQHEGVEALRSALRHLVQVPPLGCRASCALPRR